MAAAAIVAAFYPGDDGRQTDRGSLKAAARVPPRRLILRSLAVGMAPHLAGSIVLARTEPGVGMTNGVVNPPGKHVRPDGPPNRGACTSHGIKMSRTAPVGLSRGPARAQTRSPPFIGPRSPRPEVSDTMAYPEEAP